jgi:hypothetical protein
MSAIRNWNCALSRLGRLPVSNLRTADITLSAAPAQTAPCNQGGIVMRIVQWLVSAYAPLSRRWMLVEGNTWASRRAPARVRPAKKQSPPTWQGIYL